MSLVMSAPRRLHGTHHMMEKCRELSQYMWKDDVAGVCHSTEDEVLVPLYISQNSES